MKYPTHRRGAGLQEELAKRKVNLITKYEKFSQKGKTLSFKEAHEYLIPIKEIHLNLIG